MMSKFVQVSKNYQDSANSPQEAKQAFKTSCNICCSRGIKLDCERCPVKTHHDMVIAVFCDLQEFDEKKKLQ